MICKWCGNKMASSDTKCKRCGKEAPALSDCGGFYDIVSQDSVAVSSAPVDKTAGMPVYTPTSTPAPANNSSVNPKIKLILAACAFVIVIVLLVSLLVLMGKVDKLTEELDAVKDNIETVEEDVLVLKENTDKVNKKVGISGYEYETHSEESKEDKKDKVSKEDKEDKVSKEDKETQEDPEDAGVEGESTTEHNHSDGVDIGETIPVAHEHDYNKEWKFDENNHWKECTDKECEEKKGIDKHNFVGNICTVCLFEKSN